jgi:hypothetical protein
MDEQDQKEKVVAKACKYVQCKRAKVGTHGLARERAQSLIFESERELVEAVERFEKGPARATLDRST